MTETGHMEIPPWPMYIPVYMSQIAAKDAEVEKHPALCNCNTQSLEYEWTHKLFSHRKYRSSGVPNI